VFKYNPSSTEAKSLRKGNFYIGTGDVAKGPTNETGFWNGVTVGTFSYVIILHRGENVPTFYQIQNDAELIERTNQIDKSVVRTTKDQCFSYFAGQSDKMIVNRDYDTIVTDGLVLNLDAGFLPSYPGTGSSWYDLGPSQSNGALENGPTFNTNGWIIFDGADDYVSVSSPQLLNPGSNSFTVECLINQKDTGYNGIIEARGSGLHGFLWLLNYNNYGRVLFALNTTTDVHQNWYFPTVDTFGNVNQWMYLSTVVNRSNETLIFYKNGVKQGNTVSITSGGTIDPGSDYRYWIGADLGGDESNSNISVTRQYNRILSESEILQNYYKGPIVTSGLIHYWDSANLVSYQVGSTSSFSLAGTFSGSLENGVGFSSANGGFWMFDGSNDRILLNSSINMGNGSTAWTISAWVRTLTTVNGLSTGVIISNQSGGPVYSALCVNSGKICYWVYKTSWVQYLGNTTINTGNWVNLIWRNNGSNTMTFFVNGVSDGTVSDSSVGGPATNPLDIIGRGWSGNSFAGDISLLMVYNSSLTQTEISQNFNTQRYRFGI